MSATTPSMPDHLTKSWPNRCTSAHDFAATRHLWRRFCCCAPIRHTTKLALTRIYIQILPITANTRSQNTTMSFCRDWSTKILPNKQWSKQLLRIFDAPRGTNAKNCNRDSLKWINRKCWREELLLKKIRVTRRDRDGGEQKALKKQRVSLRGMFVWDVNSTVTKHSDYFVWKDTSERVARRCDDTSWQETNEFLCIKTPPFLEGVQ